MANLLYRIWLMVFFKTKLNSIIFSTYFEFDVLCDWTFRLRRSIKSRFGEFRILVNIKWLVNRGLWSVTCTYRCGFIQGPFIYISMCRAPKVQAKCSLPPAQVIVGGLVERQFFLKNGLPRPLFVFSFFSNNLQNKIFRLHQHADHLITSVERHLALT